MKDDFPCGHKRRLHLTLPVGVIRASQADSKHPRNLIHPALKIPYSPETLRTLRGLSSSRNISWIRTCVFPQLLVDHGCRGPLMPPPPSKTVGVPPAPSRTVGVPPAPSKTVGVPPAPSKYSQTTWTEMLPPLPWTRQVAADFMCSKEVACFDNPSFLDTINIYNMWP